MAMVFLEKINSNYLKKLLIIVKKILPILILLIVFHGISAQNSLSISVLNPPKKIKPGEPFTIFLEVKGVKPFDNKIETTLLLPENWNVLMSKKPSKFKGEQLVKFIFTIAPPSLATKGNYNFGIRVFGKGYDDEVENQSIEIEQVRNLEILTFNVPEFVKEGDTLRTEYIVQNNGNTSERIGIKTLRGRIEYPKSDTLKVDSVSVNNKSTKKKKKKSKINYSDNEIKVDSVTIEANESLRLNVVQIIPSSEQNSWNVSSDLQLMLKDSILPISKTVSIPVFSNKNKKSDPYLRFPIDIGAWYSNFKIGDKRIDGFQYDIRGRGDLDFNKKHHLDFIIHGPNRFNVPAVGSYDQYSLEYMYKQRSKITVGDYSLRVSNLLELGRFGRGLRFDQSTKKIDFSVFYIQPRFYPNQRDTYGGTFTLKPSEKFNISLNYMSKVLLDNAQTEFNAQFYSIFTRIITKRFILENEVSNSQAIGISDYGIYNRINLKIGRFQVNNDFVYTGKNFFGFYRDSYLLINSINYFLSRKVSLNFINNTTRLNPSLDLTVFNSSPFSQSNLLALNYQISPTNRTFLSYEMREREDRSPRKIFHFTEQFGRLAYYVNSKKLNLWYDVRYGTSQNLLIKTDSTANTRLFQTLIVPQVKVLPWLWIGGYFDYARTSKFSDDNTLRNYFYYGGSTRINLGKTFNASVNFRNNYAPDELVERRTFIDVNASLRLGNHEISILGGKAFIPNAQFMNQDTEFYTIKYAFRINAPIARNKKLSSIKGKILGMGNDFNPKGIIVQMGDKQFMTDASGNFQFNDLMPDRYYVNLVKSSIDRGIVSTVKSPMEVIVRADTTYKIEIPLTKTGAIIGKIDFIKSEGVGVSDITKQKPLVLVKLFNEKENLITKVNLKDEFSFKEIKPGKWKVLAWIPGKSDQYNVSNSDQFIDLEANQNKEILIKVSTNERKINFSNKTHQLSNKK
jgi:hypothetical protein